MKFFCLLKFALSRGGGRERAGLCGSPSFPTPVTTLAGEKVIYLYSVFPAKLFDCGKDLICVFPANYLIFDFFCGVVFNSAFPALFVFRGDI